MESTNKPRVEELKAGGGLEQPVETALNSHEMATCIPPPTGLQGCLNAWGLVLLAGLLLHTITFVRAANGDGPYPVVVPQAVESGGDRRQVGSSALKRPRPGSIWQGPREVWCFLPHRHHPSADRPSEPQTESDELTDAVPDTSLSHPYISPLLLFLTRLPTLEEVASYFAEALGEAPVLEGQQKLRFERRLVFVWGNSWRRCVLSGSARGAPGVTLDWWTNDDFGLSELREFFEAPFFLRCESERFYQWLAEGGAHETDFRGHHLRMAVRKHDGVLFVRIQWWRIVHDADSSEAPLNRDAPLHASNLTHSGLAGGCAPKNAVRSARASTQSTVLGSQVWAGKALRDDGQSLFAPDGETPQERRFPGSHNVSDGRTPARIFGAQQTRLSVALGAILQPVPWCALCAHHPPKQACATGGQPLGNG